MFLGKTVFAALEKLAWYETIGFHVKLVGFCAVVFLSASVVWLVRWLIRRRIRRRLSEASKTAHLAQLLAVLVSALNLVFMIGMGLIAFRTDYWDFFLGLPRAAIALLFIPPLTTGLTLGLLVFTVLAWKNKYYSVVGRLHYSSISVAAVAFIFFLNYWNLLGFRL